MLSLEKCSVMRFFRKNIQSFSVSALKNNISIYFLKLIEPNILKETNSSGLWSYVFPTWSEDILFPLYSIFLLVSGKKLSVIHSWLTQNPTTAATDYVGQKRISKKHRNCVN